MMFPGLRLFFILFVALLAVLPGSLSHARIYIDITSPYLKKIPVAVPYLRAEPDTFENRLLGKKISSILSNDLAFHGFFSVLDPAQYGGQQDTDWSRFRVDYLIRGYLSRVGNRLMVEFRLYDLSSGKMMTGRRYRGRIRDHRIMAHKFCNLAVKAITGESGVSLSKITFVMKNGGFNEIYSADFDGFNLKRETRDHSITLSPRYSPDGKYLAYTSYKSGHPYLYIKDLKRGTIRKLTGYTGLNMAPAWHPNSRLLAVTLSKDGNPDIYLIDIWGKIKARLTKGPGINVSPAWSPDGDKLAFVSDRSGGPQIYILNLKTRAIRRLTYEGDYNTDPQWSPRGDRIAYAGRINGAIQIFTIPITGGDPIQLTFYGSNENPSWSPDGRQLVFTSTRLGPEKTLYIMFSNGQGRRQVFPSLSGISTPFWGPNAF